MAPAHRHLHLHEVERREPELLLPGAERVPVQVDFERPPVRTGNQRRNNPEWDFGRPPRILDLIVDHQLVVSLLLLGVDREQALVIIRAAAEPDPGAIGQNQGLPATEVQTHLPLEHQVAAGVPDRLGLRQPELPAVRLQRGVAVVGSHVGDQFTLDCLDPAGVPAALKPDRGGQLFLDFDGVDLWYERQRRPVGTSGHRQVDEQRKPAHGRAQEQQPQADRGGDEQQDGTEPGDAGPGQDPDPWKCPHHVVVVRTVVHGLVYAIQPQPGELVTGGVHIRGCGIGFAHGEAILAEGRWTVLLAHRPLAMVAQRGDTF